jgi:hypothetical protein
MAAALFVRDGTSGSSCLAHIHTDAGLEAVPDHPQDEARVVSEAAHVLTQIVLPHRQRARVVALALVPLHPGRRQAVRAGPRKHTLISALCWYNRSRSRLQCSCSPAE